MKTQRLKLTTYGVRSGRVLISFLGALLFSLAPATVSHAVTLDGSSRSYLQARESAGGTGYLPGYEYLDLLARDVGNEEISAHFGGWARYDFSNENADNDVQYAFLSYKRRYDNTMVNAGRVMVFEGVASAERVDGVYARTDLAGPRLGVSAFGGRPAEVGIDTPGNNIMYGGRIFYQSPNLYAIGVSALKEEKDSTSFRSEQGIDLWFRPGDKTELLGRSSYNSAENGWMEHAYNLILGPFDKIRLNTEFSFYDYDAYFRGLSTSAFILNPGINAGEAVTLIGEEVSYTATQTVTVHANVRSYRYDILGDAWSYGARVNYSQGRQSAAGFSVHRVAGDEEPLRYTQYRAYAARTVEKMTVAVDLIDLAFDDNSSGRDNSYSATLAALFAFTESLKAGADIEYQKNIFFDREIRAFAKILYTFGIKAGGGA